MILDLDDISAGEGRAKVARALGRFSIEEVRGGAALDEGYRTLDAEFGPRGELERREVLEMWAAGPRVPPPGWGESLLGGGAGAGSASVGPASILCRYHMLLGRDEAGRVAGARDCFVTLDAARRGAAARAIVILSHTVVLPPYRRSGLAALLRAAPIALARRDAAEVGIDLDALEILLVAEMEPVSPAERDTVVRLIAYGRAGFRVLPPRIFPYAQPDFRDLAALSVPARPIPMLLLVRRSGEEAPPAMRRALVEACLRHVQAVHACDNRIEDIAPIRDHARAALAASVVDPVPLLPLPEDASQIAVLAPMLRSAVLPLYPAGWWGADPPGDALAEREALIAAWSEA